MREFIETDEPECKTCGACCVGTSGDFVPVTKLDRRRMPKKYVNKLQPMRSEPLSYILGLKRFREHQACVALKGRLGRDISCDMYAQRPEFCRTFERGGWECRLRRSEVFLITKI